MPGGNITEKDSPIDVVITWVDGNDRFYLQKMEPFLDESSRGNVPGAHSTRFGSVNEIRYCVLSVLKFAPFIRNIFIVTDDQDPVLDEDIRTCFPEKAKSVRLVSHREIFRDYEQYLPTFSSRSIESMIWRIPGLSDNFVYFNDDTFLIREMQPEDWFIENRPVLRGKWITVPVLRILWNSIRKQVNKTLLNNPGFQPRPSYHLGQWLAASLLGFRCRYFYFHHTPHPMSRVTAERYFTGNTALMEKNISFRFRHINQFNFISSTYHHEIKNGNRYFARPELSYLFPRKHKRSYIDRKLSLCEKDLSAKYMCVQSLEMCSKEDQERVFNWMGKILHLESV
jgi:hypothetical protein